MKDICNSELQLSSSDPEEKSFKFSKHPWASLFVLLVLMVVSLLVSRILIQQVELAGYELNPILETAFGTLVGIVLFFGIVPNVLRVPHKTTSLSDYLFAIRLQRPKSYYKLARAHKQQKLSLLDQEQYSQCL